jgi:hypothetical protein
MGNWFLVETMETMNAEENVYSWLWDLVWIKLHMAEQGRKIQNHVAEWEIGFLSNCWKQ